MRTLYMFSSKNKLTFFLRYLTLNKKINVVNSCIWHNTFEKIIKKVHTFFFDPLQNSSIKIELQSDQSFSYF